MSEFGVAIARLGCVEPLPSILQNIVCDAGQRQQRVRLSAEFAIHDVHIALRILEHHPEVVTDHIGCQLPSADRATDKRADEVAGILDSEPLPEWRRML